MSGHAKRPMAISLALAMLILPLGIVWGAVEGAWDFVADDWLDAVKRIVEGGV